MASMREAFAAVGGSPPEGSALDQLHLRDGDQVVNDYLNHGEEGLAIDHLLYMIESHHRDCRRQRSSSWHPLLPRSESTLRASKKCVHSDDQ